MKIFLVGGGTGGPTSPLLSVAEAFKKLEPDAEFIFIGTKRGIEKKLIFEMPFEIKHVTIPAGKWRRYFSLKNLADLFRIFAGFLKSLFLIRKYKPAIIFAAGSFVQVPVSWAGFFSGVPVVVHQQDVDLLLSTRLVAPIARAVTVSFAASGKELPEFSGLFKKIKKSKIVITGNPIRKQVLGGSAGRARKTFGLNKDYPTILVLGGGGGAAKLNEIILQALPELTKYVQVIHSTGREKIRTNRGYAHYHPYDFLGKELADAYAVADLVVSRAGMSTITELSALSKAAIIVPLPASPQEDNAALLAYFKCAVSVFEEFFTPQLLVKLTRQILWSREVQQTLQHNIKKLMPADADMAIAKLLLKIYNTKKRNA